MVRVGRWVSFAALAAVLAAVPTVPTPSSAEAVAKKPNIVFILLDDADESVLPYMKAVKTRLADRGTTFPNHILTLPRCCPSRASFLTGRYARNHGVFGAQNLDEFKKKGDHNTLATWLDRAGYRTGLIGKYLNGYGPASYVPPGWDVWRANVKRDAWSRCMSVDGKEKCFGDNHTDERAFEEASDFIRSSNAPFYLHLAVSAPHEFLDGPPLSPEWAADDFRRAPLPRPPSFNERDVSDKPKWVKAYRPLDGSDIDEMTKFHRARLRSLQVVDRGVASVIDTLAKRGKLSNTYIFFTNDNGYHLGQHRLRRGKSTPYIEDIRFPMIVRGPGVTQDVRRDELIGNIDFAPTVATLAGVQLPRTVDGRSFAARLDGSGTDPWRDAILVEGLPSAKDGRPAFTGVITSSGDSFVRYSSGTREWYDLDADPFQLKNLEHGASPPDDSALLARLEALEDCAGASCRTADEAP